MKALRATRNWRRLADEIYRPFAERAGLGTYDFSPEAAESLFIFESTGRGSVDTNNGYAQGKRLADITVAMWIEDLYPQGTERPPTIFPWELYEDPNYPPLVA